MKLEDVKERVNNELGGVITPMGFKIIKSSDQFIKVTEEYVYVYYLIYTKWSSYITLSVHSYIRCKEVEKLYSRLINEDWKDSWTLGSEVCKIKNAYDGREEVNENCIISIQTADDITKARKYFEDIFYMYLYLFTRSIRV